MEALDYRSPYWLTDLHTVIALIELSLAWRDPLVPTKQSNILPELVGLA